jgi:hypothetical protein
MFTIPLGLVMISLCINFHIAKFVCVSPPPQPSSSSSSMVPFFLWYRYVCICCKLLFNFVNYAFLLLHLCIFIIMYLPCILFHCVGLCTSGVPKGRGVVWGVQTPMKFRSFDKAELNSQFRGKYIPNNLIRIWVSLNYKLSGTPD